MVTNSYDRLIQALGADLTPVRRLAPPGARTLIWLTIVGAIALALATVSDVGAMSRRLMAAPDMWLAAIGSLVTAVLAAVAAFQLSLPDRKPAWALLPLPAAVFWVAASGIGCLRSWLVPCRCRRPFFGSQPAELAAFARGLCPKPILHRSGRPRPA